MTKKIITTLIIFIILLTIYFICFKVIKIQEIVLKKMYPIEYSEYVEKYSEINGLDKYWVYAIIKVESNFKPHVTSASQAKGLMQLMEETAVERSNVIEEDSTQEPNLYDPETNIKLGTSYFAYLLELYENNTVLALTAYNAGLRKCTRMDKQRNY